MVTGWYASHNTNFAFDNSGLYEKKLIYETPKTLRAKQLAVHLDWMDTSFYHICSHLYHGTTWKKQVCMQDSNEICQYQKDQMLTIAQTLLFQYLQHVLLE